MLADVNENECDKEMHALRLTDGRTAFSWLYRALHYMKSHGKKYNM